MKGVDINCYGHAEEVSKVFYEYLYIVEVRRFVSYEAGFASASVLRVILRGKIANTLINY